MTTKREDKIERDIYILTSDRKEDSMMKKDYSWHVIKGDHTTPQDEFLPPSLTPLPHHSFGTAGYASVGSIIFMCGGKEEKDEQKEEDDEEEKDMPPLSGDSKRPQCTNEVYYMDTRRLNDGWKKVSPMIASRESPYVFFHNGKMYVVGGNFRPFAEVYDPTCDTWHALPGIPHDCVPHDYVPHDSIMSNIRGHSILGKKILFQNQLFYDTELEMWGFGNFRGVCDSDAFMDGIIFSVNNYPSELCAYNVSKPGSKSKIVRGLKSSKDLLPEYSYRSYDSYDSLVRRIVSLGNGKLAIVWAVENDYQPYLTLQCTKLQMVKVRNSKGRVEIMAKDIQSSSYYLRGKYLDCCLTVDRPEKQEVGDPALNRRWTKDEDLKLILALQILKNLGKYKVNDGFEPGIFIEVEKFIDAFLPDLKLKADPHIKPRLEILQAQTDFVHDVLHGPNSSEFEYDPATGCLVAENSVWDAYLQNNQRAASLKDKPLHAYRELCIIFEKSISDAKLNDSKLSDSDLSDSELKESVLSDLEWSDSSI